MLCWCFCAPLVVCLPFFLGGGGLSVSLFFVSFLVFLLSLFLSLSLYTSLNLSPSFLSFASSTSMNASQEQYRGQGNSRLARLFCGYVSMRFSFFVTYLSSFRVVSVCSIASGPLPTTPSGIFMAMARTPAASPTGADEGHQIKSNQLRLCYQ